MNSEILIYTNPEGNIKIDVRLEDETVWLTQEQMGTLFGRAKSTVSDHIKNIFEEGELDDKVVVRDFRITTPHGAIAGKTQESKVKLYNLDVIISVGYRVKSTQGTQFRIWATQRLKEYRALMPPAASLLINGTNLLKNLLLCSKVLYLCTTNAIKAFANSCKTAFFSDRTFTKDNTPSRLTSVAHLGGLLFYKPLAI